MLCYLKGHAGKSVGVATRCACSHETIYSICLQQGVQVNHVITSEIVITDFYLG